ncbi:MAG: alpha/beta hydrolase [Planctomycetota bacterium]|nr:alpha/beta hydrolase [Planctomycetota bacterium]
MPRIVALLLILLPCCASIPVQAERPATSNLWPGVPPGETKELPPEADTTTPNGNLVAGRRVIRLGNVSTPTMTVYRPASEIDTGAAVIVCPGGGHHILAYDLEGTEVAEWLTSIGVTGVVLKYRVPFREPEQRWRAAVQDAQRATSLLRSKAAEWGIDPKRIGICGFSAGGEAAALTTVFGDDRTYDPVDDADKVSCRPDFAILVYPAWLVESDEPKLREYINVTKDTPPMFFVHAFDDPITPFSSIVLFTELKKAGVAGELHVYSAGGHGYGLRQTDLPVTHWPDRCEQWMRAAGILRK